jgi:hypothetical protein
VALVHKKDQIRLGAQHIGKTPADIFMESVEAKLNIRPFIKNFLDVKQIQGKVIRKEFRIGGTLVVIPVNQAGDREIGKPLEYIFGRCRVKILKAVLVVDRLSLGKDEEVFLKPLM